MKTYFNPIRCPKCNAQNDPKRSVCSHCLEDLGNDGAKPFVHHVPMPFWKEIIFFLIGLVGLTAIATVVQLFQLSSLRSAYPEATVTELAQTLSSPSYLALPEFLAYGLLALATGILIWKGWKEIGHSFKGWKPYVFGLAGFAAVFAFEQVYSIVMSAICQGLGITPDSNANQNAIVGLIGYAPVLCLLFFGVIGPFLEEMAYRVGLFGFVSRLGKPLGYIIGILVFGIIHFDFSTAFSFSENYANAVLEWLNLPVYLFSGATFCFLYDKVGFGASYCAHATNNLFSIIVNIITMNMEAK